MEQLVIYYNIPVNVNSPTESRWYLNNCKYLAIRFSIWEVNRNNQDLFVIRICYLAKHFIFVLQTEDNQKEILE